MIVVTIGVNHKTQGGPSDYLAKHLGLRLVDKPIIEQTTYLILRLSTEEEFQSLLTTIREKGPDICASMRGGPEAIAITEIYLHAFRRV